MFRFTLLIGFLPLLTLAHYTWPHLDSTAAWEVVRRTDNYNSRNPVTDVTDPNLRCYTGAGGTASSSTPYAINAGSNVTFWTDDNLYHAGVANVYLAKVPSGSSVTTWDGSGAVWFKIFQISAIADPNGVNNIQFPALGLQNLNFKIPAATPSGQYLLRAEHIALHSAGAPQFYIGCAQIQINNGGSGTPKPLVAIPGVYSATDPGLTINIYWPIPTSYVQPGPAVWTG
ncbi:lytic polysaccharide monooxygenase [Atractiella rhizophila]|nr:lytic polysaccharide monooxygenase [Atractiella rhizophila]